MNKQSYWWVGLCLLISVALIAIRYPGNLPPWVYVYNDEFRLWKPVDLRNLGAEYYGRLRPLYFLLTDVMFAAGYQGLVPGKMVSWVAALLIPCLLMIHGLQLKILSQAAIAAILLSLTPLFIYFSVVGVPDILVGVCLLLSAIAWEAAESRRGMFCYLLSGAFIGLALLIKEQTLFYFAPLVLGFVRPLFKTPQTRRPLLKMTFDARYGLALLGSGIIFSLFASFVAIQAPLPYVATWGRQLIMVSSSVTEKLSKLALSIQLTPLWLGWPLLVLVGIGLIKKPRGYLRSLLNAFALMGLLMFLLTPGPNYLVPLLPWLSLIASHGLMFLTDWLKRPVVQALFLTVMILLACFGQASNALIAYQASVDPFFQETIERLRRCEFFTESKWIFSNYWPYTFTFALGYGNATWLTTDERDAHIFEVSGLTIKAIEQEPLPAMPLEVLRSHGGIVVIMWPRLDDLLAEEPPYRLQAIQAIKQCVQPLEVLHTLPRFPMSSGTSQVIIYCVQPNELNQACP